MKNLKKGCKLIFGLNLLFLFMNGYSQTDTLFKDNFNNNIINGSYMIRTTVNLKLKMVVTNGNTNQKEVTVYGIPLLLLQKPTLLSKQNSK